MKKKMNFTLNILAWIVTRYHRMVHKVRIRDDGSIEVMHQGNFLKLSVFPQKESSWPVTEMELYYRKNTIAQETVSDLLGSFKMNRDLWDIMIIVPYNKSLVAIKNVPYSGFTISAKTSLEILSDAKEFLGFEKRSGSKKGSYTLTRTIYIVSSTTLVERR